MQVIGKHTVRIFDRQNQLVNQTESHNVITTKGRERLLDIWSFNLDPSSSRCRYMYGVEMVDSAPTAITGGTRRFTVQSKGTMTNYNNTTSYNWDTNNGLFTYSGASVCDNIFNPTNQIANVLGGGGGENNDPMTQWNCVDLARVDTEESFTVDTTTTNDTRKLIGSNLKYDYNSNKYTSLAVWNAAKTSRYAVTTDFTFDRATGYVTFLRNGTIPNGATVYVTYSWHDVSLFGDGLIGVYIRGWPDASVGALYGYSRFGKGRLSADSGTSWTSANWPQIGRPYDMYYTYRTENQDYDTLEKFLDSYSSTDHNHYWFFHPYIFNNPTNFAFVANFLAGNYVLSLYNIQNFCFFKPVYQPQTPRVIAVGTSDTSADVGDLTLGTEAARFNVTYVDRPENSLGRWRAYIDYDEYNGVTFKEVGLFTGDTWKNSTAAGWSYFAPISKTNCTTLMSRTVYGSPWSKTSDQRVELTYEIALS